MTQEKLEQRAFAAWKPVVGFPLDLIGAITLKQAGEMDDVVEREMVTFARAELEKAVQIALEQDESDCTECRGCGTVIAAKIRKLMD